MNKYHNKKIEVDGERFDSRKEYNRWCELKLLERAGEITELKRQVRLEILPKQVVDGKVAERAAYYVADFTYKEKGEPVIEDCKGYMTDVYRLKRKLVLAKYGVQIRET